MPLSILHAGVFASLGGMAADFIRRRAPTSLPSPGRGRCRRSRRMRGVYLFRNSFQRNSILIRRRAPTSLPSPGRGRCRRSRRMRGVYLFRNSFQRNSILFHSPSGDREERAADEGNTIRPGTYPPFFEERISPRKLPESLRVILPSRARTPSCRGLSFRRV